MRQPLLCILALLMLISCRKIDSDKQIPPVEIKTDTVAENGNTNEFGCMVPISAEFPGGTKAWLQFLKRNIVYPAIAIDKNIQGTVIVQFIVCTDGTVCNIEAISGPNELKESAVLVFKKSPNWIPTHINRRNIKDYKRQPIVFRLQDE
jgi:periplasmic protein TonB